jgi:hypothetical protein
MSKNWRTFGRAALALVLVASLTIVLAHWHLDSRGQDCGLCSTRHMSMLETPTGNTFFIPAAQVWADFPDEIVPLHSGFTPIQQGRAPPQVFVSI